MNVKSGSVISILLHGLGPPARRIRGGRLKALSEVNFPAEI
jgi:hypothetical protein